MIREYHIYGPPGTGKTTRAKRDIAQAVEAHGSDKVMVCSYTRAAARVIMSRGLAVERQNVGTLHSICYHALGRPTIAETKVEDFNEENPAYRVSGGGDTNEPLEVGFNGTAGDDHLRRYQLLRARLVPKAAWPLSIRSFVAKWEGWKTEAGLLDFTDLLEQTFYNFPTAPGDPAVLFVDEAQDLSPLQFQGIRWWSASLERLVLIGDDDQTIYGFAGADPDQMIAEHIPAENKRFLRKSWRLPRAVHKVAAKWIAGCSHRQEKEFEPRDEEGEIKVLGLGTWRAPQALVDAIEKDIEAGLSVMLLASCSYMLPPAIHELRSHALAFHNPYRKTRGDWNPISGSPSSMGNRIRSFMKVDETGLASEWSMTDLKMWTDIIRTEGLLRRGAKKAIKKLYEESPNRLFEPFVQAEIFEPGALDGLWPPRLEFIHDHCLESRRKAIEFPLALIRARGFEVLEEAPKLCVGTIHSVKGGEADSVYLIPDISRASASAWDRRGPDRDTVIRMFYVGLTRARKKVTICAPTSPLAVTLV